MRVRRGILQTPVIRYTAPGGREVTLILASHIGERRYYQQMTALVHRLEASGALVRYEMVGEAPAEQWAAASAEEHEALAALDGNLVVARAIMDHLDWEYQGRALAYDPSWQPADMTDLELIRALGAASIVKSARLTAKALQSLGGQRDRFLAAGMSILLRLMAIDTRRLIASRANGRDDGVIVARRNELALEAIPASGKAVLLWGADHVAGISEGLRDAGFTRAGTMWLPVGKLPGVTRSVIDVLAAILAIRQSAKESAR
jgi:hypothetical protein